MNNILIIVAVVTILLLGVLWHSSTTRDQQPTVTIAETSFVVTIADTPEARRLGLSGVDFLNENEGMFFVFDEDARHGIWMKNMVISIDILWFDRERRLIDFRDSISPETYPEPFIPRSDARYVLEVSAGMRIRNRIGRGMQFELAY
ncbi:MAG: DUF192 domain-containing protein [bacterium]|nr:DUF192 domain-containing protein [bacterium]